MEGRRGVQNKRGAPPSTLDITSGNRENKWRMVVDRRPPHATCRNHVTTLVALNNHILAHVNHTHDHK